MQGRGDHDDGAYRLEDRRRDAGEAVSEARQEAAQGQECRGDAGNGGSAPAGVW